MTREELEEKCALIGCKGHCEHGHGLLDAMKEEIKNATLMNNRNSLHDMDSKLTD